MSQRANVIRPWRVRDAEGKAHTFTTRAKAQEWKKEHNQGVITRRPLRVTSDKRLPLLIKGYQQDQKEQGNKLTQREIKADKTFRRLLRDLKEPEKRTEALVKLGRRKPDTSYPPGDSPT